MTDPKHTATAHSPELSCHHATPVPQCCQSDRVDSASTPEPRSAWYVKLDRLRKLLAPWTVTPEMTLVGYTLVVRDRRSALRVRLPDRFVDSTPVEGIYEHVRTCCEADAPWVEPCPPAACNAPSVEGGRVSVPGPELPAAGAETQARHADDGLSPDAPVVVNGRGGRQSRLDYLFASTPLADLANAANLSTGAAKYGLDNWRLIAVRDHVNHALAHLYAWLSGDRRDDHLTHADTRIRMANELAIEEQRRMEDAADEESIRF